MKISVAILSALIFQFATPVASAVPIVNPEPAALSEDIDGNGYFTPLGNVFTVEIFDVAEFLAVTGNTFGFFFGNTDATDPTNLIPIFDIGDLVGDEAVVNFDAGIVIDVDQAIVQAAFAGTGPIGFYLTLNAFGGSTLYSDPLLNGGMDYFGALPFMVDPGILAMVFVDPNTNDLINIAVMNNLAPVSVPEPSTALLMSLGLAGMLAFSRRRRIIQI